MKAKIGLIPRFLHSSRTQGFSVAFCSPAASQIAPTLSAKLLVASTFFRAYPLPEATPPEVTRTVFSFSGRLTTTSSKYCRKARLARALAVWWTAALYSPRAFLTSSCSTPWGL